MSNPPPLVFIELVGLSESARRLPFWRGDMIDGNISPVIEAGSSRMAIV